MRQKSQESVDKFCEEYPTKLFFSTSAKTGENVFDAFKNLIVAIHKKACETFISTSFAKKQYSS